MHRDALQKVEAEHSPPNSNGQGALNWPTLILVLLTGGSNIVATAQKASQLSYEQHEAIQKIRELHQNLDGFEDRQKAELDAINTGLRNQQQMLENQKRALEQLQNKP